MRLKKDQVLTNRRGRITPNIGKEGNLKEKGGYQREREVRSKEPPALLLLNFDWFAIGAQDRATPFGDGGQKKKPQ